MARPRGSNSIKHVYKQRKTKTTLKSTKKKASSSAVAVPLEEEYDTKERILRAFDTNMKYGPSIGMTRIERWERAHRFGLDPPTDVKALLMAGGVNPECLWSKISTSGLKRN